MVLLTALGRLARQWGTNRYRETADAVADHVRKAVEVDAGDQTTVIGSLYELDHATPARKASLAGGHVQAESTRPVRVGETVELEVTIRIDPRWHINAHRPLKDRLSPTRIEVEGASTVDVAYPPAREITTSFATGPMGVYEGTVTLRGKLDGATSSGEPAVTLSLQACSERVCLLPESVRLFR